MKKEHIETRVERYSWDSLLQMKKMKNWNVNKVIGTKMDYNQGTDFIIDGIHVDVTGLTKDKNENKLHELKRYENRYGELSICVYLKETNAKLNKKNKKFKMPVLCIAFKHASRTTIEDFFFYEYEKIEDLFWNKVDELGLDF